MESIYENMLKMFKNNDTVVVAVSGGPDSMALLSLLVAIKRVKQINVVCTHINHNVRKESSKEAVFVEKYCIDNNIFFEYLKIDKYSNNNFHNEARTIRYEFFDKVIKKYNAKYLLTAHHTDDLIETILMRITRGSTLRGYAGFEELSQKSNYTIYRPLIKVDKKTIINYCKNNKINYVNDKSNSKDKYTRNRFRKYIVPLLKKEEANLGDKFSRFSEKIIENENFIDEIVDKLSKKIIKDNYIDLKLFNKESLFIKKRILNLYLGNIYLDERLELSDVNVLDIIKLVENKKASGKVVLPNDYIALKTYDKLTITNKKDIKYNYVLSDSQKLPNNKEISVIKKCDVNSNYITRLDKSELNLPLIIRTRVNGDKMFVKGLKGSKKINDIFIDSKINIDERNEWPIVADSSGKIVWVPGLKKSHFDKSKSENHDIILKYH